MGLTEKLEALEVPGETGETLDFADGLLIRLLLSMAGMEKDEILGSALWTLCESVEEGGLCLPGGLLDPDFLAAAGEGRYAGVLGFAGDAKPLILHRDRLYFHRHYRAEKALAEGLRRLMNPGPFPGEPGKITALFRRLEENHSPFALDADQRNALLTAARARVFLLCGGPGSGKTTLTALLLRGVMALRNLEPARVRLCAPTGRAARRLRESLEAAGLDLPVETLHRLLGYHPPTGRFARNEDDPLPADIVLLDEASMADVFALAALIRAIPTGTALVLVGDADQLPSVEAGAVLAELRPDSESAPVPAAVLTRNHRSGEAVLEIAAAIRKGDADGVRSGIAGGSAPGELQDALDSHARDLYLERRYGGKTYVEWLSSWQGVEPGREPELLESLFSFLSDSRILTCARHGPAGCERINRLLRQRLQPRFDPAPARGAGFHGAPLLVTRNDSRTGLSNGEIGIWLRRNGSLSAHFPRSESPGKWLALPAAFVPPHEPAFAVTVHKSQGSESDHVLLVLPEAGNRLLTREIVYTGVTRARESVRLFGSEAALREALSNPARRHSGLRDHFREE